MASSIVKTDTSKLQSSLNRALSDIDMIWEQLTVHQIEDTGTLIGLPYPYIIPSINANGGFSYRELYYWDCYYIVLGLLAVGRNEQAQYIVNNLLFLIERFGMVPNANRFYMLSRSQPPNLSRMVRLVYDACSLNQDWLIRAYRLVSREYQEVWNGTLQPHNRKVQDPLCRYYDINVLHDMAEAESGWDYTTRFEGRCLDYLPIDLNSRLNIYEQDLAWMADKLDDQEAKEYWTAESDNRQQAINQYMWHFDDGFYYDYNYIDKYQSLVMSLAGYAPLLCHAASTSQAEQLQANLNNFETEFGLSATGVSDETRIGKQWSFPNGWAPLHLDVIQGLLSYGFNDDALRIATKWINLNLQVYDETGCFWEKYNVSEGNSRALDGVYPAQCGFAWTNAVFVYLVKTFNLAG